MSSGYKVLEHTADAGVRVWAKTRKALFEEAAVAMVSLISESDDEELQNETRIHLESTTIEELLLAWLKEVLFLIENESVIYKQFQVENHNFQENDASTYYIDAKMFGIPFSKSRHEVCREIKAVTRHAFHLKENGPWWEASILFDV